MMGNFEVVQISAVESSTCGLHQDLPKTLRKRIAVVKVRFVYVLCTWLCTRITGLLVKGRCPAGVQDKNRPNLASIQLRRRRPKAVDGLAISSQSPLRVVGENFPIASQL